MKAYALTLFMVGLSASARAEARAQTLYPFKDSLHRFGYADRDGKMKVPPKFLSAGLFSEGLAHVQLSGAHHAFVHEDGTLAFSIKCDGAGDMHDGAAWFKRDQKVGYVNSAGKEIIHPEWDEHERDFSNGMVLVEKEDAKKSTVMNVHGAAILPPKSIVCAQVKPAGEQMVAFRPCDGHLWGLYDVKGSIVLTPTFEDMGEFSGGLLRVTLPSVAKVGFLGKTGDISIAPEFDAATAFSNGMAKVTSNKKTFFIDPTGKPILTATFDEIGAWNDQVILVRKAGGWGLVDRKGAFVVIPKFDKLEVRRSGFFYAVDSNNQAQTFSPAGKLLLTGIPVSNIDYLRADGKIFVVQISATTYGPPPPERAATKEALDYFCQVWTARVALNHEPSEIISFLQDQPVAGFSDLMNGFTSKDPRQRSKALSANLAKMGAPTFHCPAIEQAFGVIRK